MEVHSHDPISGGVSSLTDEKDLNLNKMLDYADQALYCAKKAGRNQVIAWKDL